MRPTSRAPVPGGGARKPARRPRPGNRMGESSARPGRRRNGTAPPAAAATQSRSSRATETRAGSRLRSSSGLECGHHHGSRSQGTPAHASGRSDLDVKRTEGHAHLILRWRGGASQCSIRRAALPSLGPRTDEDTISLLRRLAVHYPDEVIAGIFNRQGRKTATAERFTANQVGSLRRYRNIPRFQPPAEPPDGELVTIGKRLKSWA